MNLNLNLNLGGIKGILTLICEANTIGCHEHGSPLVRFMYCSPGYTLDLLLFVTFTWDYPELLPRSDKPLFPDLTKPSVTRSLTWCCSLDWVIWQTVTFVGDYDSFRVWIVFFCGELSPVLSEEFQSGVEVRFTPAEEVEPQTRTWNLSRTAWFSGPEAASTGAAAETGTSLQELHSCCVQFG